MILKKVIYFIFVVNLVILKI